MKIRMLKKIIYTNVLAFAMLATTACGGEQAPENENPVVSDTDAADAAQDVTDTENIAASDANLPEVQGTDDTETEETPVPTDVTVTMDEFYGDTRFAMHFLGLKQYDILEGDSFTDAPEDGMQYLVLFLQIENRTEKEDYFNTELLSATLDGNEITNSFLVNDPESYPTIFTTIPEETTANGFVVWQVPEDWNTLELTYRGWEGNDNVVVHATLTPDDLKNPPIYEEVE